jgi:hypothetical protein
LRGLEGGDPEAQRLDLAHEERHEPGMVDAPDDRAGRTGVGAVIPRRDSVRVVLADLLRDEAQPAHSWLDGELILAHRQRVDEGPYIWRGLNGALEPPV